MKKKNNSKILLVLAGLFLIIGSIYVIENERNVEKEIEKAYYKEEDGKYVNNSEELNRDKTFEGLKIEDIEFFYDIEQNVTNIVFKATNKSDKIFKEEDVLLTFVSKKGESLNSMFANIPDLEKNQSENVYGTISGNIVDAYDMLIEAWNN